MKSAFPIGLMILSVWAVSPSVFAVGSTEDVCCILGKVSGDETETRMEITSRAECGAEEGFKVCSALADPNNDCPTLERKDLCMKCGFFWTGNACLPEDPVAKAKRLIEEEKKKEKEEEAAKK